MAHAQVPVFGVRGNDRALEQDAREASQDSREIALAERDGLASRRKTAQDRRDTWQDDRDTSQDDRETSQDDRDDVNAEREHLREMFIGVLSHDLRNPLGAIAMSAAMVLRRGNLDAKDAQTLGRVAASVDRMSRMIEQLLDFTRVRLGSGFEVHRREIDAAALAQQLVSEARSMHADRQVHFVDASPAGSATGMWDRDQLAQVFSNLVGNAIQHSPADAAVTVTLRVDGEFLVFEVRNGGTTISPAVVPTLFDPFRAGRVGSRGLGLGLYIVKQIVEAHAGWIAVTSTLAEGTTFRVRLPRAASPEGAAGHRTD